MDLISQIENLPKSQRRSKISWKLELEEQRVALERAVLLGVKRTDLHIALQKAGIKVPYKVLSEFLNELEEVLSLNGETISRKKSGGSRKGSSTVPQIPGKKSLAEAYKEKKKFRVAKDNL